MARPKTTSKVTPQQVIDALRQTQGIVGMAAHKLGVTRQTILQYVEGHAEVRQALEDAREMNVDLAEGQLLMANKRGERWAVQYTLSTLGKVRGYGPAVEHKHQHEGAVNVAVTGKVDLSGLSDEALAQLATILKEGK